MCEGNGGGRMVQRCRSGGQRMGGQSGGVRGDRWRCVVRVADGRRRRIGRDGWRQDGGVCVGGQGQRAEGDEFEDHFAVAVD